jgi:hypothetical protein
MKKLLILVIAGALASPVFAEPRSANSFNQNTKDHSTTYVKDAPSQ